MGCWGHQFGIFQWRALRDNRGFVPIKD
jgi:hypothetical protein